ncbi:3-oxoadipate enol-lactonase 2 [Paenibacillus solanacearum]|uniref:3-oxoadipate enol-lactonase 2 n=1 Tax=Paenibacillus solanacearum TaxID=2048548 RepID=A0A916JT04_9BACL|nr:3-oxoadipate enol-lactonase [Paenibacillus solanacearum]CAG7600093.1 3-oxoadipate enol-lactonase 2 [Paenibacillus solanacearum]
MTQPLNDTIMTNPFTFFTAGDGTRIAYRLDGPSHGPTVVLANSIGTTLHMWDGLVPELTQHFRVLRYDFRGHGASDAPAGAYSMDRLGRDVIELLDALQLNRVHFIGLSFGGAVGQWLAIHAPERIDRLVLSNTSSYLGPADSWDRMIASVLQSDNRTELADMFIGNWFSPRMRETEHAIVSTFRDMVLATHPHGFAGLFAAIRDMDMRRTAALIDSPTLVIAGQYDTVTLPSHGEQLAATVPNAKLVLLPVVHLSNVERPEEFSSIVIDFLLSQ